MKNAHVCKVDEGGINDPAVSINATEEAVDKITHSGDPVGILLQEINSESIIIRMRHALIGDKGGYFSIVPPFLRD